MYKTDVFPVEIRNSELENTLEIISMKIASETTKFLQVVITRDFKYFIGNQRND